MAERSPHGLPWGSLRWLQEPGHGKKLGEKGKYIRELLQEGFLLSLNGQGSWFVGGMGPLC